MSDDGNQLLVGLAEAFQKYKSYVAINPEIVTTFETVFRSMSYVLVGRFEDSVVLSELVYSASNLLVFLNDTILRESQRVKALVAQAGNKEKLERFLTILEYVEVFLELSFKRIGGDRAKWIIVVLLQLVKAALRMTLLVFHKSEVVPHPPVAPLNRERLLGGECLRQVRENGTVEATFLLERSGREMRRLVAAPPLQFRDWKLPKSTNHRHEQMNATDEQNVQKSGRLTAEYLHVLRPLAHLSAMFIYGQSSWRPWFVAGGMDVLSVLLTKQAKGLTAEEKTEVQRRAILLLLYFVRSPFFDKVSKQKIVSLLSTMSRTPILSLLGAPLLEYLPIWQSTYSYNWMS